MIKYSILFLFLLNLSFAQICKFTFTGNLAGTKVTMCFYPDKNDGNVLGHLYYGDGSMGKLKFEGTANKNQTGGFDQKLLEFDEKGNNTGIFEGELKNGVMLGNWSSPDGKKNYKYQLRMGNQNYTSNSLEGTYLFQTNKLFVKTKSTAQLEISIEIANDECNLLPFKGLLTKVTSNTFSGNIYYSQDTGKKPDLFNVTLVFSGKEVLFSTKTSKEKWALGDECFVEGKYTRE